MNRVLQFAFVALMLCLGALSVAAPLAAQKKAVVTGRVLAAGKPVANQPVALHHVTATGGGTPLAVDTTDANGRFQLSTDSIASEGITFVGTRYEGELYISDQVRASITSNYDIAVGPGATPVDLGGGNASEQAQAQSDNPRAGLVVILVAVLILGTIFSLAARQRVPPARRLLVEIAELDNQNAEKPSPRYEEQRAELVRRLRETA